MAGIKISDLPAVVTPALTDIFPIDQGAVTYKETLQQVITLFEANIVITPSNFVGTLPVTKGGTNNTTFTAYSVITAGTTATGAFQNVVGLGTAGQQLTSNGAGALPTWQAGGTVSPLTTKGDLYTYSTVNDRLPVGGTNGQFLQVASGAATGLAWSTATIPSTATNVARILRSDGTNWAQTTATFADSYGASEFLYSNGANNVAGLANAINGLPVTGNTGIPVMLAGPGATGRVLTSNIAAAPSWSTAVFPSVGGAAGNILISDGTNYIASTSLWPNTVGASGLFLISNGTNNVYSTSTIPTSAGATADKVLLSDGTNYVLSTPTFPNASATSGKFIRSDGTNWIASTPTLPTSAGASTSILTSDGTNWITSTALWVNSVGSVGKILRSDGTTNTYTTATFPTTAGSSGNVLTSDGTNWSSAASSASTSTIVDDTTTNATMFPVWVTANTGSLPLKVSSTKMFFNPSTGTLVSNALGVSSIASFAPSTTIESATNAGSNTITSTSYVTSATSGARFIGQHSRNTYASPLALASNDIIATFGAQGYGATAFSSSAVAYIKMFAAEAWSDTAQGTKITIGTTPNTTVTPVDAITISNAGVVAFPVSPLGVASGGTFNTTFTAYSVICAGTTATGAFQNVSGTGTTGYVLTANAGALPTWQAATGSGTVNSGTAGQLAYYATSTNAVSGGQLGNIAGTTTNDNAGTGNVEEFVSQVIPFASAPTLSQNVATDQSSISLTAGDWNVWISTFFNSAAATTLQLSGISTTSATLPDNSLLSSGTAGVPGISSGFTMQRVSLASTTTVYCVVFSTSVGSTVSGGIYARRVR